MVVPDIAMLWARLNISNWMPGDWRPGQLLLYDLLKIYSFRLCMLQRNLFCPMFLSLMVVVMDVYLDLGLEGMQGQGSPLLLLTNSLVTWCNSFRGCFHSLALCLASTHTLSHRHLYAATLSLLFGKHMCPLPSLLSLLQTLSFNLVSVTLWQWKVLI